MKNIFFLIALFIATSITAQSSFGTFYKANNEYSDLSIGLNTSMVSHFLSDDDEEVKELIKKAKHAKIMIFSDYSEKTSSNFKKFIKRSNFDELVKIKDEDANIQLYSKEDNQIIKEIVVSLFTDGELILIGLQTNMTHEELAKIFKDNDIAFN